MTTAPSLETAADIMQRHVVSIGPRGTIQEAMVLIAEHHVSGLPVMDTHDHCIGVITASDILAFVEDEQEEAAGTIEHSGRFFNSESSRWETVLLSSAMMDEFGSTPVEDVMTRDIIKMSPDAPAVQAALLMEEHTIHRVFVLDDRQRLLGVISALDFVRLAAATAREWSGQDWS